MEFPHGHHRVETGASIGRRLLCGAQAFGSDAAGGAGAGLRDRRGRIAGRCIQPGLRDRNCSRRRPGSRSTYRQGVLHRQQCGGRAGHAAGGGNRQRREPGAGRQIVFAGTGSGRPGTGCGTGLYGRVLQCRADVFGYQPGAGCRSLVSGLYRAVEDPGRGDPRRRSVCRRQ
ncbi:hypothetical protein D3C79_766860 [compost metagenome]